MKRTYFYNLLLLALLTMLGCNTEGGSGHRDEDGSQFLGTWQRAEANCSTCSRWIFSQTKEGGLLAEYFKPDGGKVDYAASYDPATKILLIETGGGLKASIVNGDLKMRSQTYHKVGGANKATPQ